MALKLLSSIGSGLSNVNNKINQWAGVGKVNPYAGSITVNTPGMKDMTTDFGKSVKNTGLMVRMRFPYYNDQGDVKILNDSDWVKGFLVSGFGWSIENEYENLLEVTAAQKNISKALTGLGQVADYLPSELTSKLTDIMAQGKNKALMSLQQTMAVWVGMRKPSFSLRVLFFDGEGTEATNVMRVAYILERIQYPYILKLSPIEGTTMFMQAPGGYHPNSGIQSGEGKINKTYGVSAEGTGEIHIGTYMHFPEVICTGVSFELADKILYNGNPQWLYATINFSYWRQPVLEDLTNKYGW